MEKEDACYFGFTVFLKIIWNVKDNVLWIQKKISKNNMKKLLNDLLVYVNACEGKYFWNKKNRFSEETLLLYN